MAELISAWLPFILIVAGVWFMVSKANKNYKQHVDEVNAVNQRIVDTNQEMIRVLEDIRDEIKRQK